MLAINIFIIIKTWSFRQVNCIMQGYMTCKLMNCVSVQDYFTENGILTTTLKAYNPIFFGKYPLFNED